MLKCFVFREPPAPFRLWMQSRKSPRLVLLCEITRLMRLIASFSTMLQMQTAKIMRYFHIFSLSKCGGVLAFSAVFDEATDPDSWDNNEFCPSVRERALSGLLKVRSDFCPREGPACFLATPWHEPCLTDLEVSGFLNFFFQVCLFPVPSSRTPRARPGS